MPPDRAVVRLGGVVSEVGDTKAVSPDDSEYGGGGNVLPQALQPEKMRRLEEIGDAIERIVVDQDGAEQGPARPRCCAAARGGANGGWSMRYKIMALPS
jgi:hypothetical protein